MSNFVYNQLGRIEQHDVYKSTKRNRYCDTKSKIKNTVTSKIERMEFFNINNSFEYISEYINRVFAYRIQKSKICNVLYDVLASPKKNFTTVL